MALPGEITGNRTGQFHKCSCGEQLPLEVLRSNAGYYIGYFCPQCGPWSRESGYFRTREEAQTELENNTFESRSIEWNDKF